jgi:hypothetical protein
MGWFARGARVLEGSGNCPERAWMLTWQAWVQLWGGDPESALPGSPRAWQPASVSTTPTW